MQQKAAPNELVCQHEGFPLFPHLAEMTFFGKDTKIDDTHRQARLSELPIYRPAVFNLLAFRFLSMNLLVANLTCRLDENFKC